MNKVLSQSRASISTNAPQMVVLKVNPEKIRDIIGKGGSTIRAIVEQTGAQIDIDDDGSVRIYAADAAAKDAAVNRVMEIAADAESARYTEVGSSASSTSARSSTSCPARMVSCTSRRSPTNAWRK
jgi:polyribonucleotide nucleotidyltransferase